MIYIIRSILSASLLLFAFMASSLTVAASDAVCHDAHRSSVFDDVMDLVFAANDVAVSRFTYDSHRVTRAETLIGGAVFDIVWHRDAGGLVTNIDYGCGYSVTRTYDAVGRLAAIRDSLGHEWTFGLVRGFVFAEAGDGNGALTNIFADGASVFRAAYDAQGRLASLGTNGWHCAYDALGNRVRMGDRIFLPDYDDPLKRPLIECASDGTVIRRYLWGPTGLLGFVDADDELTIAHSDEQGSVIALTDVDGNVLFRANYGPYGEDWGSSGANPTPFFWLGGLGVMKADPDSLIPDPSSLIPSPSSLYLTRHRLYSPVLRRFLSADPLGFAGGANVYAYADGNPLAYVDPLGLCAEDFDTLVRIGGFFQMLGGASEAAAGYAFAVGTAETGVGIAAGVAVGLHGTDVAYAGYRTMMDGEAHDSLTSRGLQAAGVPQNWANGIDVGVSVAGSAGVGLAARGASQSTTLYRAVQSAELSDIKYTGSFRIIDAKVSAQGKYFTTSEVAAENYGRMAMERFGDPPYSIYKTNVKLSNLPREVFVDGGIPAYVLPEKSLDKLIPVFVKTLK